MAVSRSMEGFQFNLNKTDAFESCSEAGVLFSHKDTEVDDRGNGCVPSISVELNFCGGEGFSLLARA